MEEMEVRQAAKEEFKKWVLMEEISWNQKLRQIWFKEGNRNMQIFHGMGQFQKEEKQSSSSTPKFPHFGTQFYFFSRHTI